MNEDIITQLKADWDLIPDDSQAGPWKGKIQTVLKSDKLELANVYVGKIANPVIKAGVENYLVKFDEAKINEQKPAVKESESKPIEAVLGRLDQIEREINEIKTEKNNTITVESESLSSAQNDLVEEQRQEIELLKVQKADLEQKLANVDLTDKEAELTNQVNDLKAQLENAGYEAESKIEEWKQNPAGLDVNTIINAIRVNMGNREKITFTGLEAFGNTNTADLGILLRLSAALRQADYVTSGWGADLREINNIDQNFQSVLGDCIQEISQTAIAVNNLISEYLDYFRYEKNIV